MFPVQASRRNLGSFDFVDLTKGPLDGIVISKSLQIISDSDEDTSDSENNNGSEINPHFRKPTGNVIIEMVSSPKSEAQKHNLILIERDYSLFYGSAVQFFTECPERLINSTNVDVEQFESTITEIDRRLLMKEYTSLFRRCNIVLDICSCYLTSLLCGHEKSNYRKWKENVNTFIDSENETKYHTWGIHIDSPFKHNLKFIHVYYL